MKKTKKKPAQFEPVDAVISDILKVAIEQKKPISFEYQVEKRAVGVRFGDPHAMYVAKNNLVNIHIWKTGGVSTDEGKEIPDWRAYKVKHIVNVQILEDQPCFEVAEGYFSDSKLYVRAIAKL